MTIDWPRAQTRLGVTPDGIDGPITYSALLAHVAGRPVDSIIKSMGGMLAAKAKPYGMTTPARLAEFVAQICNETGGFRRFVENLNHSAVSLRRTWPSRFASAAAAKIYAYLPKKIANKVYGDRMGNQRNGVNDDDGWLYRGRGALQLTGKDNYERFGKLLGLNLVGNPDMAADPATSVLIALEFFKLGNVNRAVDRGDFREARRITNGGAIGLEEVARLRRKALEVLS